MPPTRSPTWSEEWSQVLWMRYSMDLWPLFPSPSVSSSLCTKVTSKMATHMILDGCRLKRLHQCGAKVGPVTGVFFRSISVSVLKQKAFKCQWYKVRLLCLFLPEGASLAVHHAPQCLAFDGPLPTGLDFWAMAALWWTTDLEPNRARWGQYKGIVMMKPFKHQEQWISVQSCFWCSLTLTKTAVSLCCCSCWFSLVPWQPAASLSCGRGTETSGKKRPTFLGNPSKIHAVNVQSTGLTWIDLVFWWISFVFTTVASVLKFPLSLSNLERNHLG